MPRTLSDIFKGEHDVSGESRDSGGKWTGGGRPGSPGGSAPTKAPASKVDVSRLVGKDSHLFNYFDKQKFDADPRSRILNVGHLVSTKDEANEPRVLSGEKADPRATAAKYMHLSSLGQSPKRAPIAVTPHENLSGHYRVLDGNATTQVAQMAGWKKMPAVVLNANEARVFEESERQKDAAKKAAREAAKALGKATLADIFDIDIVKAEHDVTGEARDNSGKWTGGGSGGGAATARIADTPERPNEPAGRNNVPPEFAPMLTDKDHDEAEAMYKRVNSGALQRVKERLQKSFPQLKIKVQGKGIKNMLVKLAKDRRDAPQKEHSIGGLSDTLQARAEVPDIPAAEATIKRLHDMRDRGEITITREKNFIANPNEGYRAYHINFDQEGIHGELQIRTPLQTKWSNWMHDTIYKPENNDPEQIARVARYRNEIMAYAAQVAQTYYDIDSHAPEPAPLPPCTEIIQTTVGCQDVR